MGSKKLSRRDLLKSFALTAIGVSLAACAPKVVKETVIVAGTPKVVKETVIVAGTPKVVEKEVTKVVEKVVTAIPEATPKPVTLDIKSSQPEYANAEKQIWAIYEAMNPHVTVNVFSVNEDQVEAFNAKVAGGYVPAIDKGRINKDDYQNYVNLLDTDFPWFNRWQYDVRHGSEQKLGIPGVYTLDAYQGFIMTWQYHKDLMEDAGLDPRNDVKTWDDLKTWLAKGTAWAKSNPDIDHFWDQGWHAWVWINQYMHTLPLAFPDGQRDRQRQCWLGEIPFNADDSPYRHFLEFYKEAVDEGWISDNFWLREWETDMEASYIAKKSVMMLHGPWTWDKMLAADPSAQQEGIPATPPAAGQDTWMQSLDNPSVDSGFRMWKGVLQKPEYETIQDAFNWWFSPDTVKMRAEVEGRGVLYDLEEQLELEGPQWLGIVTEFQPGGVYEDVEFPQGITGMAAGARYQIEGSPDPRKWEWPPIFGDLAQGKMTVQEGLDWVQSLWEKYYDISA